MLSNFAKIIATLTCLLSVLLLVACDTNTTTNSVENPNPDIFKPTGTIVGSFVDAVTGEPIVGAVIDIGSQTVTTNNSGLFVMANLAATTDGTNSSAVAGSYTAMIRMAGVTAPINMASTTGTAKYPTIVGPMAFSITYSSLEDSSVINDADLNASGDTVSANHDTPITGLVSKVDWAVGKLSTTVSGEIRDKISNALTSTESFTVQLFRGAILVQEISSADGTFSFSPLQAATAYKIVVFNATNSLSGTRNFTSPGDNQSVSLKVGGTAQPLLVTETDAADPYIFNIAINDGTTAFESGADIGGATAATVTFSFSEAIAATGYATGVVPTTATELYDHLTITVAAKAGTVAHSMAWDSAMTALTVTIPQLAPSSVYTLTISAANTLMDVNNEPLDEASSSGFDTGTGNVIATFSTSNSTAVTAPTVAVINSSTLNQSPFVAPRLDWIWGAGASYYNVYRTDTSADTITSAMQLVNATRLTTSEFTDAGGASNDPVTSYIDGELAVSYSYIARAVNSDGTESANSTAVIAADVNGPLNTPAVACAGADLTVTFSEAVAETAAETLANYTVTDGTLTIASIAATTNIVVVTLSGNCTGGSILIVATAVTDIAGNALAATPANTAGTVSAAIVY